jgi:hypothetical protein
VKTELIPAVTAAVGGSALLGGIVATEARQARRMRASRLPFVLTFPLATDAAGAKRALVALSGLSAANEVIAEVAGCNEQIVHRLWIPEAVAAAVCAQLRAAIPGLRIEQVQPEETGPPALKLAISVPRHLVLRADDPVGASRALLAALLPLGNGEQITVRWALRPGRPSVPPEEPDKAWEAKTSQSGLYLGGAAVVQADHRPRARALAARLTAVLRARRGSGGGLDVGPGGRLVPHASRRSGWLSVAECLTVIGWPLIGADAMPGVQRAARQIPPSRALARHGRPLLVADDHGQPRPVALSAEAATRHIGVLGATGSGKSNVLAAGVISSIEAGLGGFLLDPQGGVVAQVLDRIHLRDAGRIAVLDVADDTRPAVGVDLFGGGDSDLRTDTVLTVLRSTYDGWGPWVESMLRLGLRTLAEMPGRPALTDWGTLFMDAAARQAVVGRLSDPVLLAQWQMYESLSQAAKVTQVAPALSRVMALIGRPVVRNTLSQSNPKLDIAAVLERRGWVLASVPVGVVGAPAARLISSCLSYVAWAAVASRAAIAPEARHPLSLIFDEAQAVADLGIGLEDLLERSRAFNVSVTIATPAAGRLPEQLRHALLSNVGTLVAFKTGAAEAATIARELPGLNADDLLSLGEYEVAARVALGRGAASAVVTGHTEPLPPPIGQAQVIRDRSAQRYGQTTPEPVIEPLRTSVDEVVGRGRRQS